MDGNLQNSAIFRKKEMANDEVDDTPEGAQLWGSIGELKEEQTSFFQSLPMEHLNDANGAS